MDNQQQNQLKPELPNVNTAAGVPQIAPNVPTAPLMPADPSQQQQQGPVQEALGILMDSTRSPYQMATQFAQVKENYQAQTYGVTIE